MYKVNRLGHNWIVLEISNTTIKSHLPFIPGLVFDLGCGTRPFESDILEYADK